MSYYENEEFYELIGDQLVTVGRSHRDLKGQGLIDLKIDGQPIKMLRVVTVEDASGKEVSTRLTTIYDAAQQLYCVERGGKNPIPTLCHRDHLRPVAVCRVCMVDVNTKRGPRMTPACQRPIEPGMDISTRLTSERVLSTIRMIVELLWSDYQAPRGAGLAFGESGENELELLARELGIASSRFPRGEAAEPRDETSQLIAVDRNACILCDRCIRGCNEI